MGEHSRTGRGENTPEKNKNYRKNKPEEGHQREKMKKKEDADDDPEEDVSEAGSCHRVSPRIMNSGMMIR